MVACCAWPLLQVSLKKDPFLEELHYKERMQGDGEADRS